MCDKQSLRSSCAYAQSDQNLCSTLEYSMSVKLMTEQHLEFQSLKGGCTGFLESIHVKMPHCWKSYVTAQLSLISFYEYVEHHDKMQGYGNSKFLLVQGQVKSQNVLFH